MHMHCRWSGACLRQIPGSGGEIATMTASHFGQCLNLYQGGARVRTMHTQHTPTAVVSLPALQVGQGSVEDVVGCAEGHQVRTCVWCVCVCLLCLCVCCVCECVGYSCKCVCVMCAGAGVWFFSAYGCGTTAENADKPGGMCECGGVHKRKECTSATAIGCICLWSMRCCLRMQCKLCTRLSGSMMGENHRAVKRAFNWRVLHD
jgi:hypothetical protein